MISFSPHDSTTESLLLLFPPYRWKLTKRLNDFWRATKKLDKEADVSLQGLWLQSPLWNSRLHWESETNTDGLRKYRRGMGTTKECFFRLLDPNLPISLICAHNSLCNAQLENMSAFLAVSLPGWYSWLCVWFISGSQEPGMPTLWSMLNNIWWMNVCVWRVQLQRGARKGQEGSGKTAQLHYCYFCNVSYLNCLLHDLPNHIFILPTQFNPWICKGEWALRKWRWD